MISMYMIRYLYTIANCTLTIMLIFSDHHVVLTPIIIHNKEMNEPQRNPRLHKNYGVHRLCPS